MVDESERALVAEALAALGIRSLVLAIHDVSFPGVADEDVGRGSPYGRGGAEFLRFAAGLGFTGIQLGPQGKTSLINPSPYDGTLFAQSPWSIALGPLARDPRWRSLLTEPELESAVALRPAGAERRVHHRASAEAMERALTAVAARWQSGEERYRELREACTQWTAKQSDWLPFDDAFETRSQGFGTDDWTRWPDDTTSPGGGDESIARRNQLTQWIVHRQHEHLHEEAERLGLKLIGDLQIGVSHRDKLALRGLFLPGYQLGAPPSRTNPAGQPWGYPVLNPDLYGTSERPGPVRLYLRRRVAKLLRAYDGLRIDHPHGLICPWVYRSDDPDSQHAVANGARLFASPAGAVPGHDELARFAVVGPDQVGHLAGRPRFDERWVSDLRDDQIARYAVLLDEIVGLVAEASRSPDDLLCEVLSTCPTPVAAALARHKLGRFRVVQKADPNDEADPYRTERAAPEDWVMPGTHDTPPLWSQVLRWDAGHRRRWARYLTQRLFTGESSVSAESFAARLQSDTAALSEALFADLFVGPAKHVSIFFADLLGMTEIYNRPGVVAEDNWTLRVPPDYAAVYPARRRAAAALNLPRALHMAAKAQRARGADIPPSLIQRLGSVTSRAG